MWGSFKRNTISPIDGSHRDITNSLGDDLSEAWLIKARVKVEIEYLIHFFEARVDTSFEPLNERHTNALRGIYKNFKVSDAQRIKDIEVRWVSETPSTKAILATNHDVKAVEYFVREKLWELWLWKYEEYTHIGLTSQDINNTAVPMMIDRVTTNILIPSLKELFDGLQNKEKDNWILADNLKKLANEINNLETYTPSGKFGWATWGFNALHITYPSVNWPEFGDTFLQEKLGLKRQQATTQIEHYDPLMSHFNVYKRIGSILRSISVNSKITDSDAKLPVSICIGTMIAYIEYFAEKLPVSRHQRDLSDSTVTRNFWVPLGYMMIAIKQLKQSFCIPVYEHETWIPNKQVIVSPLTAIWAIDGRYRNRNTQPLASYFSSSSKLDTPEEKIDGALNDVITPVFQEITSQVSKQALNYHSLKMLAHTHWQEATPTDFWKEFQVFTERLVNISDASSQSRSLEEKLDFLGSLNTILLDFSRDMWLYIHVWYLKQKIKKWEVGSSAMPHKVNPIDFENAEGNLWLANALLKYIVRDWDAQQKEKIIGEAFSFVLIALNSIKKGLWKIEANKEKIEQGLHNSPMVLAEAIQTYCKGKGITWAYESLRDFTRGKEKTLQEIHKFINSIEGLSNYDKQVLKISPAQYVGQYPKFASK